MMKTFRWKVKPGMDMTSVPPAREMRFGNGYSQRAPAGLSINLKIYNVMLFISHEGATALEPFLTEHGGWKAFLWTLPYSYGRMKVTYVKWLSQVSMLRVELSAEFKRVVN